ncbi:4-coumarate--CoA ligase-like 9 [Prosopis cineraria]|uniref:4-coumarate--CoA ligase-like 9 n=1 Tax=Prosopis cineraria TaxID=364024 RepID=UPI00240EA542|nr:4-coumarate--CoA ligase-like 9 [Prosopis cineraria]
MKNFDSKSGFSSDSRTFHSLRPPVHLPPPHSPLSASHYALSLHLKSPWSDSVTALVDSASGHRVSFSEFIHSSQTLASNLQSLVRLSKGDTAFVLSPNLVKVPILYFALLSLGVVVSPANPISTPAEISHLFQLSSPAIAFSTSSTAHKLPHNLLRLGVILLDSPEFDSLMTTTTTKPAVPLVEVSQSDLAAILYSSGTTGKVKGVMLTHRNLIALAASYDATRSQRERPAVFLYTIPYFHVYGFTYSLRSVVLSETVVLMERFRMEKMLKAVDEFRVTHLAVAPPVVVAMAKGDVTDGYDLSSLEGIACGAAPLGKDAAAAFKSKFPRVVIVQGYGLTETTASICRTTGEAETIKTGTTGKLIAGVEAKIVDPDTGLAMFPGQEGELWLRGPSIAKGYVGDPEANSATFVDGWLRTGDLCYIDHQGYLYVVDRLKELIKYKGYQVAPAELENLLHSHSQIKDAAVIPYPDEEAGQVPMAFVVRQPQSSLSEADVIDFIAKQVSAYKKIRRVLFVSSIPKNAGGKILRKDLSKFALHQSISKL